MCLQHEHSAEEKNEKESDSSMCLSVYFNYFVGNSSSGRWKWNSWFIPYFNCILYLEEGNGNKDLGHG